MRRPPGSVVLLAFLLVLSSSAWAQMVSPAAPASTSASSDRPAEPDPPSQPQIILPNTTPAGVTGQLVDALPKWHLVQASDNGAQFQRDGGFWADLLLGSSYDHHTIVRLSCIYIPSGRDIRLLATAAFVSNPGGGFERLTTLDGKSQRRDLQQMLDRVASHATATDRAARPGGAAISPSTAPPAPVIQAPVAAPDEPRAGIREAGTETGHIATARLDSADAEPGAPPNRAHNAAAPPVSVAPPTAPAIAPSRLLSPDSAPSRSANERHAAARTPSAARVDPAAGDVWWMANSTAGTPYYRAGCAASAAIPPDQRIFYKSEDEARKAGHARSTDPGC